MARKAFNFFASYFDVAKELNDKDRLAFYDALILEQFTGKKTELKGMAKFAYVSQQHSIDAQINGFNQRIKRGDTTLEPLSSVPPAIGAAIPPAIQEKEKEEGKGKEEVQYVSKKPLPIPFEKSEIFDKINFAKVFEGWSQVKMLHYYEAAIRWSAENHKYIRWELAIKSWAKKDELNGVIIDKPKQKVIIW